jgi:hypothetical protein
MEPHHPTRSEQTRHAREAREAAEHTRHAETVAEEAAHMEEAHATPRAPTAQQAPTGRQVGAEAARPEPPMPDPVPEVPPPLSALAQPEPVDVPPVVVVPPSPHHMPEASGPPAPTLAEAFQVVCAALKPLLLENAPAHAHVEAIQGWYRSTVANQQICWGHAMRVLEGVLGGPLRES